MRSSLPSLAVALASVLAACVAGLLLPVLRLTPTMVAIVVLAVAVGASIVYATDERRAELVLLVCVAAALLLPPLHGGRAGGTPILFADLLVAACAFALFVGRNEFRARGVLTVFAVLAGFVALALLGSTMTSDTGASWRDLWIFVRLAKYALVLLVGYEFGRRLEERWNSLWLFLLVPFSALATLGIAQYYSLFGVSSFLSDRYGGDPTLLLEKVDFRRAFSTVGNSNYFGFLCAVGLIVALWIWLTQRGLRSKLAVAAVSPAFALGLFVSGSRAALLALVTMLTLLLFGGLVGRDSWRRTVSLSVALAATTPLLLNHVQALPIAKRFFFIWSNNDPATRASFEQRRQVWDGTLALLHGHWLFGVGPDKGQLVQWVDNDFLHLLRQFGLVGTVPEYLAMVVAMGLFARRIQADHARERAGGLLGFVLLVGLLAFGLTADVLFQDQVMSVMLVLFGVSASGLTRTVDVPA